MKPVEPRQLVSLIDGLLTPESVRRVLIVDDEEVFRYMLRQHLGGTRYIVYEAATGSDAILVARSEHPDVILLDLQLPDIGGREVLHRLASDPETREIPVVIVTSSALSDSGRRELTARASAVLQKDALSRDRAIAAVTEALRGAEAC